LLAFDITLEVAEKTLYETIYADIKDQAPDGTFVKYKLAEMPPELDSVRACSKKTNHEMGPTRGDLSPHSASASASQRSASQRSASQRSASPRSASPSPLQKTDKKITRNNVTRTIFAQGNKEFVKFNKNVISIKDFEAQTMPKKSKRNT
jgi:hypothetical protein